ncbi:MAG: bis(5'-nucleosyl)-tetraphosphatase (symmetrical) YqeK [bacterium]
MDEIERTLVSFMTKERLLHTKAVKNIAFEISSDYNIDDRKLELASLLHDIAKDIPKEEMEKYIEKYGIVLDEIEKKEKGLWHGIIGAYIVEEKFKIKDPEILEAIKFHSTGKPNMNLISKLLYIADYIETCPDDKIIEEAKENIDLALKKVVKKKIEYVLSKGCLLHPRSIELWNNI